MIVGIYIIYRCSTGVMTIFPSQDSIFWHVFQYSQFSRDSVWFLSDLIFNYFLRNFVLSNLIERTIYFSKAWFTFVVLRFVSVNADLVLYLLMSCNLSVTIFIKQYFLSTLECVGSASEESSFPSLLFRNRIWKLINILASEI